MKGLTLLVPLLGLASCLAAAGPPQALVCAECSDSAACDEYGCTSSCSSQALCVDSDRVCTSLGQCEYPCHDEDCGRYVCDDDRNECRTYCLDDKDCRGRAKCCRNVIDQDCDDLQSCYLPRE